VKKFLSANYEKIALCISLLCLGLLALVSFLSENPRETKSDRSRNGAILLQESKTITLESKTPHGLMPGDLVFIDGAEPESFNGNFTVETIILPKNDSEVSILLSDGKTITGEMKQPKDLRVLKKDWRSASGSLSVRTEEESQEVDVRIAELEQLWGATSLTIATESLEDEEWKGDFTLQTYQRRGVAEKSELAGSGKWIESSLPNEGEPSYDLFTPPVLYVVDGRLETSLPEEAKPEKPPEEFGLRLDVFEKVPYRFRIGSWVNQTPHLVDTQFPLGPSGSGRYVSNRIEVGVPYKANPDYPRRSKSSLTQTNAEDPDKIIMVDAFVVQHVQNPKTGITRPIGRALIKDYRLFLIDEESGNKVSMKPFEINSFMDQTHAGQYRIVVESTSKDHSDEKFTFEQNGKGTSFPLALRDYKILEIDLVNFRVHIEKQALDPPELQRQWLGLLDDK
jgi:hypothetical protein